MSITKWMTGLQHVGIPTNDLEKSVRFYQSLGFEMRLRTATDKEQVAFLEQAGLMLEIYGNGHAAERAGAIDHLALDVTDIGAVLEQVKGLGYTALEGEIQALPFWERGVRYFTIQGPDGEKIEFNQKL